MSKVSKVAVPPPLYQGRDAPSVSRPELGERSDGEHEGEG